jgi:hypothetical protein
MKVELSATLHDSPWPVSALMSDSLQESDTRSNGRIHRVLQGFKSYFRVLSTISVCDAGRGIFSHAVARTPSPGVGRSTTGTLTSIDAGLGSALQSRKNVQKK